MEFRGEQTLQTGLVSKGINQTYVSSTPNTQRKRRELQATQCLFKLSQQHGEIPKQR